MISTTRVMRASAKPNSVAMKTPPKLSNVMPSLSSELAHSALADWFQYLPDNISKNRSFCSSNIVMLNSSCNWLPCWMANAYGYAMKWTNRIIDWNDDISKRANVPAPQTLRPLPSNYSCVWFRIWFRRSREWMHNQHLHVLRLHGNLRPPF